MQLHPGQYSDQALPMGVYPQPGYPSGQPGYPPPQPGFPPNQPGYSAPGPAAYPPPQQAGYPQPQQADYPPQQPGFQPPPPSGYPTPNEGYLNGPPAQPFPPVITNQPGQGAFLGPPGLEYLAMVDQLLIKQKIEVLEAFTEFETANKYKVLNSLGQEVFTAKEDTDCCSRQCCGPTRPFEMNIMDNQGQDVMLLVRPLRCQACCFPCCLQELEVHSPPGTVIGYVEQEWSIFYPKFVIKDEEGEPVMKIEGPFCVCECSSDVNFVITSEADGNEVGKISKQWSGLGKEIFTDADNFGINFPIDLDVKVKATLLGATFLIDFMYFEKQQNNN
eukprot:GFUD01023828.1.p1 GENE.GFUD01023828.1~~GFUD01023828.1.p1  ORF type:complete len:332 (-),score=107.04 GFUD01023828.1:184-1179(-)